MSICASLELLVSRCILICLCVILVTHILFSTANLAKCTVTDLWCPLWFLYGSLAKDVHVACYKALRTVWNVPPTDP